MNKPINLTLNGDDVSRRDGEAISEAIYEALMDRGIFTGSFSWSLDVDYYPESYSKEMQDVLEPIDE